MRRLQTLVSNLNPRRYTEVLMYGMMCVLLAVGIWLLAATKMGLPVGWCRWTPG